MSPLHYNGDDDNRLGMIMNEEQEKFLRREFWMLSWRGSMPRPNKLYDSKANDSDRSLFREYLIDLCEKELLPMYKDNQVFEWVHYENIEKLKHYANSRIFKYVLDKPYTIGLAQKLLNLQLKYLWCAGMSNKSPHCPIDSIILSAAGWAKTKWPKIDSIACYKDAINAIAETAKAEDYKDIVEWEINTFTAAVNRARITRLMRSSISGWPATIIFG